MSGLLLCADELAQDMAALDAATTPSTSHVLPHFASGSRWYTGIAIANPNDSIATATLTIFSDSGEVEATQMLPIPAQGKVGSLVSSFLSGIVSTTGWMNVSSDLPVVVFLVYGDFIFGGVAALPSSERSAEVVFPHFVNSQRWWTGIAVVNPSDLPTQVTLTAYAQDGTQLEEKVMQVPGYGKKMGLVEGLLPNTANNTGWIKASATGGEISGLLVYGDKKCTPNRIAALSASSPETTCRFSHFRSYATWWTGIALLNPDASARADVTLTAYTQRGRVIDSRQMSLDPHVKFTGLVDQVFTLGTESMGWIESSANTGLLGVQVMSADEASTQAWGLAGIESQAVGQTLLYPHFIDNSRWWTLFAVANSDPWNAANVQMEVRDNDGRLLASPSVSVPPHGAISSLVLDLLGM